MLNFNKRTPQVGLPVDDTWALIERGENFGARVAYDRLAYAAREAGWYRRKKRTLQRLSKTIRLMAMLCLTIGGIMPLISKMSNGISPYVGYMFLAGAGSLLLADRVFGVSAGWQRFMMTATKIESLAQEFRVLVMEAINGNAADSDGFILSACRDFTKAVSDTVQSETETWMADLNNGRNELSNISQSRRV